MEKLAQKFGTAVKNMVLGFVDQVGLDGNANDGVCFGTRYRDAAAPTNE